MSNKYENSHEVSSEELLEYELKKAEETSKTNEEYRKIIRAALGKWLQNLQNGVIKLESVHDLKVLIEADEILRQQKNHL